MSHDEYYAERQRCSKCGGLGWRHEMKFIEVKQKPGPASGMVVPRQPRPLCPECYKWVTENRNTGLKAPNE